ncbi:MAG: PAS domain S-box protein [Clostridiales bacterium]|nr:PAS domain S-box protein [Clostridiales bacterium]
MQKLIRRIYSILLLLILLMGWILFSQYQDSKKMIEGELHTITEVSMKTTAYEIREWINQQMKVIEDAAYFISFDEWNGEVIYDYFKNELNSNDNFNSLYFGTPNNEMINGSDWIPPEDFDLRTRIWYQNAIISDDVVVTDVFMNASGENQIITMAKAVFTHSGHLIGVVGGDITLNKIVEIIDSNSRDNYLTTFLINSNRESLTSNKVDMNDELSKRIIDESVKFISDGDELNQFTLSICNIDNELGYIAYMPIENSKWVLVNYVPIEKVLASNSSLAKQFSIVFIVSLVAFILFALVIRNSITNPIMKIENSMKKIDIEMNPAYRISWNKKWGFDSLVNNINYLLENIENHIEVIKIDSEKQQVLNVELEKNLEMMLENERTIELQKLNFEALFKNSPDAIVRFDNHKVVIDVNDSFVKLFGFTLDDLYGRDIDDFIVTAEMKSEAKQITEDIINGESFDLERDRIDKNGNFLKVRINGVAIKTDGEFKGGYSIYTDMTQRKKNEDKIIKQKVSFEALFKNSSDAIVKFDINHRILEINENFTSLFGYEINEILGKNVDDVISNGEDNLNMIDLTDTLLNGIKVVKEGIRFDKKGHGCEVDIQGVPIISGDEVIGGYGIYTDIANRRYAEKELAKQKTAFEALFTNSSDAIVMFDKEHKILDINKNFEMLFDYTLEEISGKYVDSVFSNADIIHETKHLTDTLLLGEKVSLEAVRFAKGNKERNVMIQGVPIISGNEVIGGYGIYSDISERKKAEDEIIYISYHDQLTGLYNRRFFEEELKRLDHERNLPLALIMADVNGLKLINDAFGHIAGDELLKITADIIKKACRNDEIIARLGGDEFIILLPNTNYEEAEIIVNRIKTSSREYKLESIEISVSFGFDVKHEMSDTVDELFKRAEDYMYRHKLIESPSVRGRMFETIIRTLHEKNKREERHSSRVSELSEKIGAAYGLSAREVFELKSAGWLHDIGKIAIDDNILNKKGKLNEEEWVEIKRHPEVGYRILNAVNEMTEISQYVLAHHERWDGKGYPRGLKENEIPVQSRIICVADAFDAMTRERTYREVLTDQEAIDEIQKNSGIQFDPKVVDVFVNKVMKTVQN